MLLRLFLLFTLVPIAELAILIRIGGWLGLGPTLALVLGTGAAGAWLARREGLRSWLAVRGELAEGRLPTVELVHGLLILVAGIVLITPGVITDAVGLLLLIRPVRSAIMKRLRGRFEKGIEEGTITVIGGPAGGLSAFGGGFRSAYGSADDPERRRSGYGPADDPGHRPEGARGREILVDEEAVRER